MAEARAAFENPRERMLLLADGEQLVGAVRRDHLSEDLPPDAPLGALADTTLRA